ncbi:insulin-like peptide INSL5 precursor [Danio rerio]|uniref:Insulin-like 5a precursor n=1 Tax=Danio rerio TaxID=7955 RepID=Q2VT44_DANRE|nr:insulin-like 5a precursor [Danio rerio]AAX39711.1 relaxin 3b [Danio rerio]|eukprot:NP_001032758.1 insulin-like 5a precursor [Danio rerio]
MRSMCRPAVLLPVLLLWSVCSVWEVQADVRTVKLCGREFIRAVVYTCGGSRWRRLSSPQDGEGFLNGGVSSSVEDLGESLDSAVSRRDLDSICCQFGCKKSDLTFLC